jgi:hypothetical protein
MFIDCPQRPDTTPRSEQNLTVRPCAPASQRTVRKKAFGDTARMFVMALAVCTGGWLGIRPHGLKAEAALPAPRSQSVQTRPASCSSGNMSEIPPGYTLVHTMRIGEDCFALLKAQDTYASPALGLSSGEADVYGRDGRVMVRFFALGRPDGKWELFQYRRLPARENLW